MPPYPTNPETPEQLSRNVFYFQVEFSVIFQNIKSKQQNQPI